MVATNHKEITKVHVIAFGTTPPMVTDTAAKAG